MWKCILLVKFLWVVDEGHMILSNIILHNSSMEEDTVPANVFDHRVSTLSSNSTGDLITSSIYYVCALITSLNSACAHKGQGVIDGLGS